MAWMRAAGAAAARGASASEKHTQNAVERDYEITANPGALYFAYRVEKEGWWWARRRIDWVPTRVYDDGQKTVIEMPRGMIAREMPVLLVREGGKDAVVNMRVKGQHFVVDRIFDKAVLVKGVGTSQERVAITREKGDD
jgi:type IV secretion system protein VirB9